MKVVIFAGTSEGRELTLFCRKYKIEAVVCVATEYGQELLPSGGSVAVRQGRLTGDEMTDMMKMEGFCYAVDATHPYAVEVSQCIKYACENSNLPYYRIAREQSGFHKEALYAESVEAAANILKMTEGNIFITTGSKQLAAYLAIEDKSRLYVRVLPSKESLEQCEKYGIFGKHLICMQGPFSEELNYAMLRQIQAAYLVTKESGSPGGFEEKMQACEKAGVTPVIIGRPREEHGYQVFEMQKILLGRIPEIIRKIVIAGIGMGASQTMTAQVAEAVNRADALIGARRMVESVNIDNKPCYMQYQPDEIRKWIEEHPQYHKIVILMSGDTGFYSGTKNLLKELEEFQTEVMPGISTVSYLCSKQKESWEDVYLCSIHGKQENLLMNIRNHRKVFALMEKGEEVVRLCRELIRFGMEEVRLCVGEHLSYADERLLCMTPKEASGESFLDLCAVLFINEAYHKEGYEFGLSEECFIRGNVPMTKSEVRAVSIAKLRLKKDSLVYDVGAGTGSVSIEIAMAATRGYVYAIEKEEEGISLIEQNKVLYQVSNLEAVRGIAPEAFKSLPAPTHAFLGGTAGNMRSIVKALQIKNPDIRIVINAITLESIGEALEIAREYAADIVQISIAKGKEAGAYHMMMGQNPVTIISFSGRKS